MTQTESRFQLSRNQTSTELLKFSITMASMYCVKCRAKKEVANPEQVTMKNGKKALRGTCPDCGTKMFKIGG